MEKYIFITAKELAVYLKLNVQTIYRMARMEGAGRLPCFRIGPRSLRFDKSVIDKWLYENSKEP